MTFSEILQEIPISKGSLSYWLKDIKLTAAQLSRVEYKNQAIKDKFIRFNELRSKQADMRKRDILKNATQQIDLISDRELKFIGIALYWAEGYKGRACKGAEFTNSDPAMIRLMMRWFRKICQVNENKFRIRIQVHGAEDINKIKEYWSVVTGIPGRQFTKFYTKISPTSKKKMGNIIPYGICSIRISDINLITTIQGWIRGFMALSSSPA